MTDLPIDKPAATRIARRLASALERQTGHKPGHQTAMTLLAEALGHNSLHAFTAALDAAAPTKPAETLDSEQLIAVIRRRGDFAYHLPAETAAEIVTGRAEAHRPAVRAWLDDAFDGLRSELDHQVNRTLRSYAAQDGGPHAATPDQVPES